MIGQKLGSFRIEAKLGSGAMGVVYRCVHETNGRQAAVKVVTAELTQKGSAYERFKREAEILQQFRHPHIVRFLAVGRSQGTSYFAMEYIPGPTLDKLIQERGFLPWQEVVDLGIQICDALHYAHQHGVVHRDLKPSNLMVTEDGQVKLTDFGIAKDINATALTATGRTVGTAAYMAPEQIRGTPGVSHKTDLYALGVLMYQMLTGDSPFGGPTAVVMMHRHLNEPAPQPSTKLAEIPVELDRLVTKLMAKEPADRPWDAAAVGMALTELRDKLARGEPIPMVWPGTLADGTAISAGRPQKKGKRKGRRSLLEAGWLQTGALVLALAALVGLVGYQLWPPSAAYLYRQAEAGMTSDDPSRWILAQKEYLDELDRRFPRHPYRNQTQAWRDKIALHQVRRRADVLEKPNLGALSRPKTAAEKLFVSVYNEALEDSEDGRDVDAARRWRDMAAALRADDPDDRRWALLARERAAELETMIRDRRLQVIERLKRADALAVEGQLPAAFRIRYEILRDYAKCPELAELVAAARAGLPPSPAAEAHRARPASPAPAATGPEATEPAPPPDSAPAESAPAPPARERAPAGSRPPEVSGP